MTQIQTSQINLTTPTQPLKGVDIDSIPDVNVISDADFRKYIYTGISCVIDTPIVKTSRNAIIGVNTDGFIPWYTLGDTAAPRIFRNLFPVQSIEGISNVRIYQEQFMLPVMSLYASHRFISGSVGVGIRITSNTSQSGNLLISQGSGLVRRYFDDSTINRGLSFLNSSTAPTDFSQGNFSIVDISLNRQFSVRTTRRDPNKRMDLAKKLNDIGNNVYSLTTQSEFLMYNNFASQFQEDWLFISPLSNVPNQNANQITLSFFFDFSTVTFETPIYPVIPMGINTGAPFLNYTATFLNTLPLGKPLWTFGNPVRALEEEEALVADLSDELEDL